MIGDAQLEQLADLVAKKLPVHDPGEWLSVHDLCDELKISKRHLEHLLSEGRVPSADHCVAGRKRIWLRSTVDQVKRGVEAGEISL